MKLTIASMCITALRVPSIFATSTTAPSLSGAPSLSAVPSGAPTTSTAPSLSAVPSGAPSPEPEWEIDYERVEVRDSNKLILRYQISSTRLYKESILQNDCSTEIGGIITLGQSYRTPRGLRDQLENLELRYDIDTTAVPYSPIWNQTAQKMELCLKLNLIENEYPNYNYETGEYEEFIIAEDKQIITIGFNSTADFSFENDLQDSVAGEASSTANLDDYVEACKCTEDEIFECDPTPLAPNEVFHVCVKSSSSEVRIRDVTQMNIDQGEQSLVVVEESDIKYSSFSSKTPYPLQNGHKINVLLPINLFNFSGSNVTVEGTLEMQLGEGRRALRKLASQIGPEATPFKLEIALTDTPLAPNVNGVLEEDSAAPPGFLVPVLAVVGSVSLLGMAGMVMVFRKRRAGGGIVV